MPYIDKLSRMTLDSKIKELIDQLDINGWRAGEINYVITKILDHWFTTEESYLAICEIMGTLDSVGKEFYREVAVPYEEKKKEENGDVYTPVA